MRKISVKQTQRNFSALYFAACLFAFCISIFMIASYEQISEIYKPIVILPIFFFFGSLLLTLTRKKRSVSIVFIIFFFGSFIKNVISPWLFLLGGCQSFYNLALISPNILRACIFMAFQFFIILLFSFIVDTENHKYSSNVKLHFENNYSLFVIILILLLLIIFAYFFVPEIQLIYRPFWKVHFSALSSIRWDNETIVARGSIERYIYSLFMFTWPIVRCIVPLFLIKFFYTRYGTKTIGVIFSSLSIILPFMLLGGDNLAPFISSFFSIVVMRKLYGKKANFTTAVFFTVTLILMSIIIMSKVSSYVEWRGATGVAAFSQIIYSYFPGFDNVALVMGISSRDKFENLFFDIYDGIPFANTLFGISGGTSLNDLYSSYSLTSGQIIEWGSNIGYYFSYLISPFISGLFFVYLLKIEKESLKTNNFWEFFILLFFSVYSSLSMQIYSVIIFFRLIFNIFIPLFIILKLTTTKTKNRIHEKTLQRTVY